MTSQYQSIIRSLAPTYDAQQVEALLLTDHRTLDALTVQDPRRKVFAACRFIDRFPWPATQVRRGGRRARQRTRPSACCLVR
jgi:hypothetical protein